MNYAETVLNVLDSLTTIRAMHGAPSEIDLLDGSPMCRRLARITRGWSKSAINNGSEVVFLVLDKAIPDDFIRSARSVKYGDRYFEILKAQPPNEPGGFWLLPVREK